MKERKNTQFVIGLFIFGIIAMALQGIETIVVKDYQTLHEDCRHRSQNTIFENPNDGDDDFILDEECFEFPYEEGNGESETPYFLPEYGNAEYYQPYFDLTVDYVRFFVMSECGGQLANCIGTNFQNEVQFYCFFSDNVMAETFPDIFNRFFNNNPNPNFQNDGSLSAYLQTCNAFPTSNMPSTLPSIEYQESEPIDENPDGEDMRDFEPR